MRAPCVRACVRACVRNSKFCVCLGVCVGLGVGVGENLGKEGNVSFIILVSPINVMLTILHLIQIKVALYEQFFFCHSVQCCHFFIFFSPKVEAMMRMTTSRKEKREERKVSTFLPHVI